MSGPPRVPTEILIARGSSLAQSRKESEPTDAVAAPPRPAGLSKKAIEHWGYIVPRLLERRTLTESDLGLLTAMCIEWGAYMDAVAAVQRIEKRGKPFKGHLLDHPRVRLKGSFERYSKAAIQFGLTPAAKARVIAGEKPKEVKKPESGEPVMRIAQ